MEVGFLAESIFVDVGLSHSFFKKTKKLLGQISLYKLRLRLKSEKHIGNLQHALFVYVSPTAKHFYAMNIICVVVLMSSYCHFSRKIWKHVLTCKFRLHFSHRFCNLTKQLMG